MAPSVISDPSKAIENYIYRHNEEFAKSQTDLVAAPRQKKQNPLFYALPIELFNVIISHIYYGEDPESVTALLDEFSKSVTPVNKLFNRIATPLLYRYCVFTRPNSFYQFLQNLNKDPQLGLYVHTLDFMEFTSIGLGRTGKMNQEIQMLTDQTILQCLERTPFLEEFLACESIDTDIDLKILEKLFCHLDRLKTVDFCGSTNAKFVKSFEQLHITEENDIENLSFHDCTNLMPAVFTNILPWMPHLKKLDLSHTLISAKILNQHLHKQARLTHLSLARCTNLTTRELMEFLMHNEAVNEGTLNWLNLQVDSSNVSPLNATQLSILLKNLNAPGLLYLNLGGLPIMDAHLQIILNKFPNLQSLGLSNSQLSLQEIIDFLTRSSSALKQIDLSGCKSITKWTVDHPGLLNASNSVEAIEVSNKISDDLPINIITPLSCWKVYDNNRSSRRSWVYKVSETERNKIMKNQGYDSDMINNLTFYDMKTGKKIKKKIVKPGFLKYASKKINCSRGFYDYGDDKSVFPVEFSERGIYKYYSLNK